MYLFPELRIRLLLVVGSGFFTFEILKVGIATFESYKMWIPWRLCFASFFSSFLQGKVLLYSPTSRGTYILYVQEVVTLQKK